MRCLQFALVIILLLVAGPLFFAPNALAGTEDATMSDLIITATPHRQGVGGEILIDASISFFGGCCYPLFAYDIETTIFLPENVEMVSGQPTRKIDEVEAHEGGSPTTIHFKWTLKSLVPDTYTIKVNLTTDNCGDSNEEITLEITEGFSMTIPQVYPDIPTTNKNSIIRLDITSSLEGIEAETVNLFYVKSTDNMPSDAKEFYAENGSLNWSTGSIDGKSIEMNAIDYAPSTWKGAIPSQNKDAEIYYWVVVEDNMGKNTTSVVYSIEVLNIDRVYFFVDFLNLIPIIGILIGIFLIVYLFNKVRVPYIGKGEFVLGTPSSKNIPFSPTPINYSDSNRLNQRRNVVVIILLIISIFLLFWAIYSGYLEEFTHLNGGL